MKEYLHWAYLSIVSGILYHLILKKMSRDNYDHTLTLIYLHIVLLAFLGLSYWKQDKKEKINNIFNDGNFVLLLILGGFFSFINHSYGYKAFMHFRNPGYYQALLTLELVGITILATYLFKSHIGLKEMIGIGLISLGSIVITWSENKTIKA